MRKLCVILMMSILFILLAIIIPACSGGKSPVEPSQMVSDDNVPGIENPIESNRGVVAVYDAIIDPDAKTFTVTPAERTVDYHFPLSKYYPNVLKITGYGFTPNFWANIRLSHPFPGSGIDGFDPRVIAVLPANTGVSMFYPNIGVLANNSVLLNNDGYTWRWDRTELLGNANPFIAYFKEQPHRIWSSTGVTEETRNWQMNISGFGGHIAFYLIVDVSTNFPNPPQPITDNALNPVKIDADVGPGLTINGGSALIEATILYWHNADDAFVMVEAPELFNDLVLLEYAGEGPNEHEYIFRGWISNELNAPAGEYKLLISASGIESIFQEYSAVVEDEINFNPVVVNTINTMHHVWDCAIDGNYLYFPDGIYDNLAHYLRIFNISIPESAYEVNSIPIGLPDTKEIDTLNGYAYVTGRQDGGMNIIDVDPPESAHSVSYFDTLGFPENIKVKNSYAYIAAYGLYIINVEQPESPFLAKFIEPTDNHGFEGVDSSDEYAYVLEYTSSGLKLNIVDITPPEDAEIIKSVDYLLSGHRVCFDNNYVYTAPTSYALLHIIDVEIPETASVVKTVNSGDPDSFVYVLHVTQGYAYVLDYNSGMLYIIDVEPYEIAHVVTQINLEGVSTFWRDVEVSEGYAYVIEEYTGIIIIKLW